MFSIATPKDVWLITIVLALLIMALYPRSEWM